ncbi:unnamed protein product [Alopecurus aequalis]
MARKLMYPACLTFLALLVAVACAVTTGPADTTAMAAAATTRDSLPVPAAAGVVPVGSTTTIPTTAEAAKPATAMAAKKFPLTPPDVVEPAAEVVTALPVPVPETLPSAEGLGFGPNGFGTNGGFGGGGCCGGFGYNGGLGYGNGFFNSAPAQSISMTNGLVALLMVGVAAMLCM